MSSDEKHLSERSDTPDQAPSAVLEEAGTRPIAENAEISPSGAAEGTSQALLEEDSNFDDVKETSRDNSPSNNRPMEAAAALCERRSDSSDTVVKELNRLATALDHRALDSGKLIVFQKYFSEPEMKFFVKPEGRRRHNAERQDPRELPVDVELQSSDEQSYARPARTSAPPMPIVNQAGALVGYLNDPKTSHPQSEMAVDHFSELEHSIGSASTVPIEEAYLYDFSQILPGEGSADAKSTAGISEKGSSGGRSYAPSRVFTESDSMSGAFKTSSHSSDLDASSKEPVQRRKSGATQTMGIPRKEESGPEYAGSFPGIRPKTVPKRSSMQYELHGRIRSSEQSVRQRRMSVDSSVTDDSIRQRETSKGSFTDDWNPSRPLSTQSLEQDIDMLPQHSEVTSSEKEDCLSTNGRHSSEIPELSSERGAETPRK